MGDHRASIKIQMEFHGEKKECDMWINYSPSECCGMDSRVTEFFTEVYEKGMHNFEEMVWESEKEEREKAEKKKDLEDLARLKAKYEKEPS